MGQARLRALRPQIVVGIIERNGFVFARAGKHGDIYRRASDRRITTVPRAGGKSRGKGGGKKLGPTMVDVIRRQTGKREDEFIAL